MYLKKCIIIAFVCFLTPIQIAMPSEITLDELKKIVTKDQNSITRAHIVYIYERTDNEPIKDLKKDNIDYKLRQVYQHALEEKDLVFDVVKNKAKVIQADLRDINTLLRDYNIPDVNFNKDNADYSKTILYQGDYGFDLRELKYSAENKGNFMASFSNHNLFPGSEFANLGLIPLNLLDKIENAKVNAYSENGKSLLSIEWSSESPTGTVEGVIICDPSIGYRFRKIQWKHVGNVFREIIANDYKNVNEIPYPFLYTSRSFDASNGILKREVKYMIERAEFGIELSDDNFKVFVPAHTPITDFSVKESLGPLDSSIGRKMGMDDIMALSAEGKRAYREKVLETQIQ